MGLVDRRLDIKSFSSAISLGYDDGNNGATSSSGRDEQKESADDDNEGQQHYFLSRWIPLFSRLQRSAYFAQ
jgi:hypothetical protein